MSDVEPVTPSRALELGWSIIPVGRKKLPLADALPAAVDSAGHEIIDEDTNAPKRTWKPFQQRRASAEEFANWQALNPAGFAVVCGAISKLIVIDFDGESGVRLIEEWKLRPHVRTGSGGYHLYIQHPGWRVRTLNSKSKRELGSRYPGLDIRADGGYAVFFGHNEVGQYQWLRAPELDAIAVLPSHAREFLGLEHKPEERAPVGKALFANDGRVSREHLLDLALDAIRGGDGRNDAGFWLACQLRDNRYEKSEAYMVLREFARRCPQSNAKGEHQAYTEHEALASTDQAYSQPAREPWAYKDSGAKPVVSALPAGNTTLEKLISFLRTFDPVYKRKDRRIYFRKINYHYSAAEVYALEGGRELVMSTPEFAAAKDKSEKSLIVLAKELFKIAALRLASCLPDEEPKHDGDALEAVRESIIQFLILPRVFYSRSGTPTNQSYASWLTLQEPDEVWRQCSNHAVYGRASSNGSLRLSVKPEFLLERCVKLSRMFASTVPASKYLLQNELIDKAPEGASKVIKCEGRAIRTWELCTSLIDDACGVSASEEEAIFHRETGYTVTNSAQGAHEKEG